MYELAVNDIVEVRLHQYQNGCNIFNVYHYAVIEADPGNNGKGHLQNIIDQVKSTSTGLLKAVTFQSTTINYFAVDAQKIYPVRYRTEFQTINVNGSVGGTAAPQNVSASLALYGELATRSNVGRKAFAGLPATVVANGRVADATRTLMAALGDNILLNITSTFGGNVVILQPIILHRSVPATSATITSYYAEDTARIQRRRTVGLGV